jgi:histidine triad (HIT) family protein
MLFSKSIANAVKQAFPCKKVGMCVIGLEVPHAHIHLIPINTVADMNFSSEKLKPSHEELALHAERIISFL